VDSLQIKYRLCISPFKGPRGRNRLGSKGRKIASFLAEEPIMRDSVYGHQGYHIGSLHFMCDLGQKHCWESCSCLRVTVKVLLLLPHKWQVNVCKHQYQDHLVPCQALTLAPCQHLSCRPYLLSLSCAPIKSMPNSTCRLQQQKI
jgi:hypothetical protein